jgi:hypothetical protein
MENQLIVKWEKYLVDEYIDEYAVKSKETSDYRLQQTLDKYLKNFEQLQQIYFTTKLHYLELKL